MCNNAGLPLLSLAIRSAETSPFRGVKSLVKVGGGGGGGGQLKSAFQAREVRMWEEVKRAMMPNTPPRNFVTVIHVKHNVACPKGRRVMPPPTSKSALPSPSYACLYALAMYLILNSYTLPLITWSPFFAIKFLSVNTPLRAFSQVA